MRLSVLLFGFLQLSLVSGQPSPVGSDEQTAGSAVSRSGSSRAQVPQSTGPVTPGRKRPLFARRGQYERQRVQAQKPKKAPQNAPPLPPVTGPKPAKAKCSQLTQSCMPQSGCCDTGVTCHCRFFNAICFCRKTNSPPKKKTKT